MAFVNIPIYTKLFDKLPSNKKEYETVIERDAFELRSDSFGKPIQFTSSSGYSVTLLVNPKRIEVTYSKFIPRSGGDLARTVTHLVFVRE